MRRRRGWALTLVLAGVAATVLATGVASAQRAHDSATVQQVEFIYAFTGSGTESTTFSVIDQRASQVDTYALHGTLSDAVAPGSGDHPNAGVVVRCERRSAEACAVTYILTVSPTRTPVKASARVGPHATLTARLLPGGPPVYIGPDTQKVFELK